MKVAIVLACIAATAFAAPGNNLSSRIVGGEPAADKQFPYIASLRYFDDHICAGTILDETTILCAANCLDGRDYFSIVIKVGNNKLDQQTQEYKIKSFNRHEKYNASYFLNDIVILKLDKPIEFSDDVQPVKLRQTNIGDEEEVIVSGWGITSFPGSVPNDLLFIQLKTISIDDCRPYLPVGQAQVCTLTKRGEGICEGDAGGPLVDSNGEQVGIVSWNIGCAAGAPDVYTRIYSFLDWIEENRK